MSKTFTLSEAQTLLPLLDALMKRAQAAGQRAGAAELEMQQLSHRIFFSGGMRVDVPVAARRRAEREKAGQEAKDSIAEIAAIGVGVEEVEDGVLDFPCVLDGQTVLLCWRMGETAITHWHTSEEGAAGRKPLDARFPRSDRERLN